MSNFIPLHIISGYSFLKSGLTVKKIIKGVTANKYLGAGLTDFNGMYGYPEFSHAMEEINKPYILGMNIEIEDNNVSIFALSEKGYRNIIKILSLSQKESLNLNNLEELTEDVIAVIETNHGKFKEEFLKGINQEYSRFLMELSRCFHHQFYLGIEVTSKEEVHFANSVRSFANERTYECVAFPRIRYLKSEDAITVKITEAISKGETLDEKKCVGQEYFMSEVNYSKIYSRNEIENTYKILKSSDFKFNQKRGELLTFSKENGNISLKETVFKELENRHLNDEEHIKRLNHELDIISQMGYEDYFLLVQDYVNWAKNHDILVGPGRGSAAGSLVSYLLNIIVVDPLKYDLQFERFLNPNRKTMPDIDVDFMDTKRDEVIEYMREKYGQNRVANIVAFQTIQAKQALRDIGRVFQYPERHITLLSKSLTNPKLTLGQSYKLIAPFKQLVDSDDYFKEFVSLAGKIEGLPRQAGQHASGVVVNQVPLDDVIPVTIDFNGNFISQFEAPYLEEEGFLKMDFLGLRNLTTIDRCVKLVNAHYQKDLKASDIPYDSPEIFEFISKGNNIGLFQIETVAMKRAIQIIQPKCFDDVVALLALNRPGPMQFLSNYARRRDGLEKFTYLSDGLKDILSSTYGIIVYQEQVNQIAIDMAGFTPGEADLFRRAISKKDKDVIVALKKQFIEGAINKGYSQKTAQDVFDHIQKFANYGFNKSHSVVYAIITCQMAYLKYHYPLEFYAAILETGASAETKLGEYISEISARNIKVLPPSINYSTNTFVINDNNLIFPLSAIKGFTDIALNKILLDRNKNGLYKDYFDFVTRMYDLGIGEGQINKLIDAGALDELHPSRATMRLNIKLALQYAEINRPSEDQLSIGIASIAQPIMAEAKDNPLENLDNEYEALGVMLSSNPLEYKKDLLNKYQVIPIRDINLNENVTIAGIIKSKKIITTKKNQQMAFVKIFDQSGDIEMMVFPTLYEQIASILEKNNIIVVKGRLEKNKDETAFIANEIKQLEEE